MSVLRRTYDSKDYIVLIYIFWARFGGIRSLQCSNITDPLYVHLITFLRAMEPKPYFAVLEKAVLTLG